MTRPNYNLNEDSEAFLESLSGPEEGRHYPLGMEQAGIGRAEDNVIIIQSGAVSRRHAILYPYEGGYVIRDNGSKNGIQVNGQLVSEVLLSNGDMIQIGEFSFRYHGPGPSSAPQPYPSNLPAVGGGSFGALPVAPASGAPTMDLEMANSMAAPMAAPAATGAQMGLGFPDTGAAKKKGPNKRFLIYGVVALLVVGLYMMTQDTPTDEPAKETTLLDKAKDLGGEVEVPAGQVSGTPEPGLEDPLLSSAERQLEGIDYSRVNVLKAYEFHKKGLREYLNKNYQRAIQFFLVSIDLDGSNSLSNVYLRLSIAASEEQAKSELNLAYQYFSTLQYQRSIYHFEQVISYMGHKPDHEIVKQSRKYIEVAQKHLRARELFP